MDHDITDPNIRWHYDHNDFSYDPETETEEQGKLRSATEYARAEAWLAGLDKSAKRIAWDYDPDGYYAYMKEAKDNDWPEPDMVLQLYVKVTLPPRTTYKMDPNLSVSRWQGDVRECPPVAVFWTTVDAEDYIKQKNAPRVFTFSLCGIAMMRATERDDTRMFEAQAALELLREWEQS